MNNPAYSAKTLEKKQNRREMLRSLARWLALGALGSAWAVLSVRSARNSPAGPCVQSPSCGQCPLLEKCELPQAVKIREGGKRQ